MPVQGQIVPRADDIELGASHRLPALRRVHTGKRIIYWLFCALLMFLVLAGGGLFWWRHHQPALPLGFALGNGRLEADEINISTKFAGRISKLFVDQGDMVKAGQVVAEMDTQDLQAQLKRAEAIALQAQQAVDEATQSLTQQQSLVLSTRAMVDQAQQAVDEANADLQQRQSEVRLAKQELDRTATLVPRGVATVELLDRRRQVLDAAMAAEAAATARIRQAEQALIAARHNQDGALAARNAAATRVGQAEQAREAATYNVEFYKVNIADNTLIAPRDGPIEYRMANIGEVLPAGGKVFTMLDASYVYMDIYLPTAEAGKVRIGSEARVILDAYPDRVIPARAVYVAHQAQFTPKTVETKSERDKLMFRIRIRIDPELIKDRETIVRSGLPGVAYVRIDPSAEWPPRLQPSAAPSMPVRVSP